MDWDLPEASEKEFIWTNLSGDDLEIEEMETEDLKKILKGFKEGKAFWGQYWKKDYIEQELRERKNNGY